MTDPKVDGWYRASSGRATFAFRVEDGEVVECAPYGRKMIMGLQWGTAYMVLEQGGFTIARMGESEPEVNKRAMQFGYLLSEIEVEARALLDGRVPDIMAVLTQMKLDLDAAILLASEVSREALDQVAREGTRQC